MLQEIQLDSDTLAATLAQLDVHYLRTTAVSAPLPVDPEVLIAAVAQHPSPRVREALLPLFLRHPEFAAYVPPLATTLPAPASLTLRHWYTAAVYLQRLWHGKLEMFLGRSPLLPDHFGQSEWGLPAPTKHYGEAGLRVLAAQLRSQSGDNWLSTYQTVMTLFLDQLKLKFND